MTDFFTWMKKLDNIKSQATDEDYKGFLKHLMLFFYGRFASGDDVRVANIDDAAKHLVNYYHKIVHARSLLAEYSSKSANYLGILDSVIADAKRALDETKDENYSNLITFAQRNRDSLAEIKSEIEGYSKKISEMVSTAANLMSWLGRDLKEYDIEAITDLVMVLDKMNGFPEKVGNLTYKYDYTVKDYTGDGKKTSKSLPESYKKQAKKMIGRTLFNWKKKATYLVFMALLALSFSNKAGPSTKGAYSAESRFHHIKFDPSKTNIQMDNALNIVSFDRTHYKMSDKLTGYATTYAAMFEGRKTASGEIFRQDFASAAVPERNSLFGKTLLITSRRTGRSIIVKANDTGNFGVASDGTPLKYETLAGKLRVVDLSQEAQRLLGHLPAVDSNADVPVSELVDVRVLTPLTKNDPVAKYLNKQVRGV